MKGGSLFAQGTFFDSEIAPNSEQAISTWLYSNNIAPEFSENHIVSNVQTYDYGTVNVFGNDDVRVPSPMGSSSRAVGNAINLTLKDYNTRNNTFFSENDTYPKSGYNKDTDDFFIEIYSRDTNEFIGTIDKNSIEILKSKD